MRNRAKCKLCQSVIESFHEHDYVTCKCGHISIDGGLQYFRASAIDWKNFLRVDDEDNEIIVTVKEKDDIEEVVTIEAEPSKITREDLIKELGAMIKNIENLPQNALQLPITHYDYLCGLMIIKAILDKKE